MSEKFPKELVGESSLTVPCEKFDFSGDVDPGALADHLARSMMEHGGIGLAANQLGINAQAFVIKANPIIAVFNPRIVACSTEEVVMDEGCLSFPGLIVKVKRPESIRVRYTQPNGEVITRDFEGMTARIFQHEFDHVNGILFFNRANLYHREKAFKDWKLWKRKKR